MSIWAICNDQNQSSVGCFKLGMSVFEAQFRLQQRSDLQACDIIYSDKSPFSVPIIFFLRDENIRLEFDSVSQNLVKIVAEDMTSVKFSYNGSQCFLGVIRYFFPYL